MGRYLRVAAGRWRRRLLHIFAELSRVEASLCPPRWPPALAMQHGTVGRARPGPPQALGVRGAGRSLFVLVDRWKLPDFVKLLGAVPLGIGLALAVQLGDIWPPPSSLYAPLAGGAAIVAAAVASQGARCPGYDDAADASRSMWSFATNWLTPTGRQVRVVVGRNLRGADRSSSRS